MSLADIPVWEWCWMSFAAVSAVIHCFVLATIVRARQRRSNIILKAPFFTIIFIQGIHELLELCTTTGFNRFRKYRIIKYALEEDNELVEWQGYWYIFLKNILYFGHVEIAINRLSAVIWTKYNSYDKLWNTKNIIFITVFGYFVSALLRAVVYSPDMKTKTFVYNNTDFFSFEQSEMITTYNNTTDIVLSLGSAIVCVMCYTTTAFYRGKYANMDAKTRRQELALLRIGLATFLILLPTSIRSSLELWADLTKHEEFYTFISKWNMLPAEAMCVFQPWLLLLTCKSLRESMFYSSIKVSRMNTGKIVSESMSIADIPVWEWCWMVFAAVSALMHGFVLLTIIQTRHRRAKNILKAPFFTIIFIQGIHELLELFTATGFNRLRKYRIIKYAVEEDNQLVEWQWYWYIFLKNILYFGHVEIAINRLSAVILTKHNAYDKLWNTRNIILMTIVGYFISAALRAVIYSPDLVTTTLIFPGTDVFSFDQTGSTFAFENMTDIVLSFGSAIICVFCYSTTAILQRKYTKMDEKTKKQELILLKIGLATFLILLPTAVRSGLELWAHVTEHEDFLSFIVKWNMLPAEAMCILQPWLLLLSCRSLRESMFYGSAKVSRANWTSQSQHNSNL